MTTFFVYIVAFLLTNGIGILYFPLVLLYSTWISDKSQSLLTIAPILLLHCK